jgi:hypothetical protein
MKVDIADATDAQLFQFATERLNLDVQDGAGRGAIVALMTKAGYKDTTIEVPDAPRAPVQARTKSAPKGGPIRESDLTGKMVTVLLPEQEGELEMEFVSVNGSAMYIRRGVPSEIKYEYFCVLQNAKKMVYDQTERDGLGTPRLVSAYPIQILDMDPDVRAFMQQQRAG